jgi:CubicO group peptidase (beta-lactamase class C family)
MLRRGWAAAAATLLVVAAAACSESPEGRTRADARPGADWVVASPEDHGMDPDVLEEARDYAFADGMHTQGVVVVYEGEIVAEWYADGEGAGSWAASWSMAKSFASALVGIAIGDGLIASVDEPMTTWFPEWEGTSRQSITLRDVLQMSSGLDWVDPVVRSLGAT